MLLYDEYIVNMIMKGYHENKNNFFTCYIDCRKAFTSSPQSGLLNILEGIRLILNPTIFREYSKHHRSSCVQRISIGRTEGKIPNIYKSAA